MQSKVAIMIKSMKKAFFFLLLKKNDYVGSMSFNEKIVLDKSMSYISLQMVPKQT